VGRRSDLFGEIDEALFERLVDALVDDESLRGDTPLTGRLERGQQRRVDCHVEIRVFRYHDGVFPAHLAGRGLPSLRTDSSGNLVTDFRGPGKEHGVDAVVTDECLACVPKALYQIEHTVRNPRVVEHLRDDLSAPGRLFCWLPDDGVALDECDRNVPERDGDRGVPGGDTADDTGWLASHVRVLRGDFRGDDVAVGMACVARRPLDHMPRLGHVRFPLAYLFAGLSGDDFPEFMMAVAGSMLSNVSSPWPDWNSPSM
jgi:hypothetical protein